MPYRRPRHRSRDPNQDLGGGPETTPKYIHSAQKEPDQSCSSAVANVAGARRHSRILMGIQPTAHSVIDTAQPRRNHMPSFNTDTVKMHWWTHAPNFGDLLAPWLAEKITGKSVEFVERGQPAYVTVGSILSHVSDGCIVWGTGSFGTETPKQINSNAEYTAVRGPLTRNKLETQKIHCPRVYGDPALLTPRFHSPSTEKTHEVGIVLRWSERKRNQHSIPGVKPIFLGGDDIEGTIEDFLACENIISTSLHGLIIADAYDIPNAWLDSRTPKGLEYKYWDYLISVGKTRNPQSYRLHAPGVTAQKLLEDLNFDARHIDLDLDALYEACPFKP